MAQGYAAKLDDMVERRQDRTGSRLATTGAAASDCFDHGFATIGNSTLDKNMQTKQLGNSDLALSLPLEWAHGPWAPGWAYLGSQDIFVSDSISAIRAALDRGVNWIDTAAVARSFHAKEVVGARGDSPIRCPFSRKYQRGSGTRRAKSARASKPIPFVAEWRLACGGCNWSGSTFCIRSTGRSPTSRLGRGWTTLAAQGRG